MKGLKAEYIGFMFGALLAFAHGVWALMVAFGYAQGLMDWVFWIHFLNNPFQVTAFDFTQSLMLIAFTFAVGYVVGWVVAHLWNMLHHPQTHTISRKSK